MSEEERIRRAEQLSEIRNNRIPASSINSREKKKMSALTKLSIQILTSICIFGLCYFLYQNNSYALEVIKPVISLDTDFKKMYFDVNDVIKSLIQEGENDGEENKKPESEDGSINQEEKQNEENIESKVLNEEAKEQYLEEVNNESNELENDINYIKKSAKFIKPIDGVITSKYGERESNEIVSSNHEGVDIGAEEGIEIKASMEGIAEVVSEEGDYGKHIKITNGEISTLYAHCSELLIQQGEKIEQGKVIAKVGNTGKSTGPHLHFEIRRNEKAVNPEEILEF